MKKISLEVFNSEGPQSGYYASAQWRKTASSLLTMQPDECIELEASDFGIEEGTLDWSDYPTISDASKIRSLTYARGMRVSIYRDHDERVIRVRCVSR